MVDIIIPTYKARETLPQTLDSLVSQTKKMFIVTIVQDCDDEDYTDIIKTYKKRGLKCRLIKTPQNMGPGVARQYGMDSDRMSDYFMFVDSDDILMPRAVEVLSREIQINKKDLVASDFLVEKKHSTPILFKATSIPCTWTHGKIYRAKYLRDNNIRFLNDLRLNEDAYFNLVAHNCTEKKTTIPEVTYLWRDNKNSLTRQDKSFFSKSWVMYIKSQVEGLLKIIDILNDNIDAKLIGLTIINIYKYFMRAVYESADLTEAVRNIRKLKSSEIIQNKIDTEEFWRTVAKNLTACSYKDENELFFFTQRFPDWLNKYVLAEIKEKRVYR